MLEAAHVELSTDLGAEVIEHKGHHNDEGDDEEPDELCSNTLFLILAVIAIPAVAAHAFTVTAVATILADATASFTCFLHGGKSGC